MSVAKLLDETYADTPITNSGVCVADGYGLRISIQKRHLVVADGQGAHRRTRRYPKVGHGLRRLVILGHTGTISLEALRWLDRVGIVTTHIDTDGQLLTQSVTPGPDNARLRRAQALAPTTTAGLEITRRLLDAKLAGQANVATTHLDALTVTETISDLRTDLADADTLAECREIEAAAAAAYFPAWTGRVRLTFARNDLDRIPDHWTHYTGRRSLLPRSHGSARNAADPVNAILNYLYALAEIECRNACHRLGLDPGLGILHTDNPRRDSLALDIIEPLRPHIDAWTIDLADGHIFRADDFHETDTGNCRILPPLTHHLANTLPTWQHHASPWAEMIAHHLADQSPLEIAKTTPLTSTRRRAMSNATSAQRRKPPGAKDSAAVPQPSMSVVARPCRDCGNPVQHHQRSYCPDCWPARRNEAGVKGTAVARDQLASPTGRKARSDAISAGKAAAAERTALEHGYRIDDWAEVLRMVQGLTLAEIMAATSLSIAHASRIRTGKARAHPRHWAPLQQQYENKLVTAVQ